MLISFVCESGLAHSHIQTNKPKKSKGSTMKKKILTTILISTILLGGYSFAENTSTDFVKVDSVEKSSEVKQEKSIEVKKNSSLFETIKDGGSLMFVLGFFSLLGMILIIERSIYFFISKSYKKDVLKAYLEKEVKISTSSFKEEIDEQLRSISQIYFNRMEKGMSLLNGIGNLAPLIGFLGTVIGMIDAFAAIAAATTVNAKVVAVGIQVALVTTAGGLSVAVPVLGFFHFFNHIIQRSYADADAIIQEITKELPSILSDDKDKPQRHRDTE